MWPKHKTDLKNCLTKKNFYFKAAHYFIDKKIISSILKNANMTYKSPLKAFQNRFTQGTPFKLLIYA